MGEDGCKVTLNVYDLSQGLARQLSTTFLGRAIEGIWHTGVVVYGNEYYFGGGIQHAPVGATPYGTPLKVVDLGVTYVPKELFEEFLQELSPRYTAETYSLLKHNCNNFSNEVAQFLVGTTIPEYILQLPNDVMSSPMGPLILPMIQQLETTLRSGAVPQAPQFKSTMTTAQPSQSKITTINPTAQPSAANNLVQPRVGSENTCKKPSTDGAAKPFAETTTEKTINGVAGDPLGGARMKVQEEISTEFAALMASGTHSASEAATLATKRVMERHGRMNAPR